MKILILHGMDDVATARRTSIHHAFFLLRHAPSHEYWLQAAHAPITPALLDQEFDAVIIDTTFLCWRWTGDYFREFKAKYEFVRKYNAVKIAFPQDDYDHSEILEEWLQDWKVDVVYTACFDDRKILYPTLSNLVEFRSGYTGLFEPADLDLIAHFAVPWHCRTIDVGYRARRLPAYFGWFGKLKSDIADRFLDAAAAHNVSMDISCKPEDTFSGDGWLRFLGGCRFILGCESGSSLIDSRGDIRAKFEAYIAGNPESSFEEIAANCFPGQDRAKPFAVISPRLFEAAAAGCGQILVPGRYDGVLNPWEHYLPLEPDASNIDEIVEAMADTDRMERMIKASQMALLENPRFLYSNYAADVMSTIYARRPDLKVESGDETTDALLRLALTMSQRWAGAYQQLAILVVEQSMATRARTSASWAKKFSVRTMSIARPVLAPAYRLVKAPARLGMRFLRRLLKGAPDRQAQ